jgi:hypothetical protein
MSHTEPNLGLIWSAIQITQEQFDEYEIKIEVGKEFQVRDIISIISEVHYREMRMSKSKKDKNLDIDRFLLIESVLEGEGRMNKRKSVIMHSIVSKFLILRDISYKIPRDEIIKFATKKYLSRKRKMRESEMGPFSLN